MHGVVSEVRACELGLVVVINLGASRSNIILSITAHFLALGKVARIDPTDIVFTHLNVVWVVFLFHRHEIRPCASL